MNTVTDFSSWSRSLEDVARNRWGRSFRPQLKGAAFAPKLVREPRAYDKTPAVMLVASSASALLHKPLFDAVELLEKATGAFKVVVFTDCPPSSSLRDYDWAVEHCMAEPDWDTVSTTNWLEMAGKRLVWAARAYKPAFVLAAIDEETAVSEIRRLGRAFSIDEAVLEGALALLRGGLKSLTPGEHPTLRGWMGDTTSGQDSTHKILRTEYDHVELRIARRRGRITLLTEDSECTRELRAAATNRDWSVISVPGLDELDLPTRKRLFLTADSAFEDTLTFHVRTGRKPDLDAPLRGGLIIVGGSVEGYSLEIADVAEQRDVGLDGLVEKLERLSRADRLSEVFLG